MAEGGIWVYLLIGVIVPIIAWYIKFRWQRRRMYELISKIKQPDDNIFFGRTFKLLGSADKIFKNFLEASYNFGPNCAFWMGAAPMVCVGKPEDLEIVLQSQHCVKKSYHYEFTKDVVGNGLFSAPVELWRKTRKIIQPTFNSRILESFVPIFGETSTICVQEILPKFVGKKEVDFYDIFSALNLDTISQTAMGLNTNAQRTVFKFSQHLQTAMKVLFIRFFYIFWHFDFTFQLSKHYREYRDACTYIDCFTDKVIREKKVEFEKKLQETKEIASFEEAPSKRKVFLELLLEINSKEMIFSDRQIRDEVKTFFVGGTDTSAVTACFFLSMMGMHQDIQQQVYEEIIDVLGPDRTPEFADLAKLKLLERCIKETMRLFSPAPFVVREVQGGEIQLSDCLIPEGACVAIMIFYTQRSDLFWEEPLTFKPDRFLPENFSKKHPYSFLPFSGGLRGCVGVKYSYMNLKVILSQVLRKYRVYCDYKSVEEIEVENYVVIKPKYGFKCCIEERKHE